MDILKRKRPLKKCRKFAIRSVQRFSCSILIRRYYTVKCFVQLVSQCYGDIMAKMVARQVARAVAQNRIKFYFSCKLSRNHFGRCRVCYTVKLFRATCPATIVAKTLRDKLHETFHSIIVPSALHALYDFCAP